MKPANRKPGSAKGVPKPSKRGVDDGFPGRLKAALGQRPGLNVPQLADEIGCSGQVLWNYLSGKNKSPEALLILALADALKVSARWILTGRGDISSVDAISPEQGRVLNTFNQLSEANRDFWISQGEDLLRRQAPAAPSAASPFKAPSFARHHPEKVKA